MNDVEAILKRWQDRYKEYQKFVDGTGLDIKKLSAEFKETMRNLSLILGASGAAGLASLNLNVDKIELLVLMGSLLMIILGFLAIAYLLDAHKFESDGVMKFRTTELKEMEDVLNDFAKVARKEIPMEEYLAREKSFDEKREQKALSLVLDSSTHVRTDHMETLMGWGLFIGAAIFNSGFLLPIILRSFGAS